MREWMAALETTGRLVLILLGGAAFVGAVYLMGQGVLLLLHGGGC